MPSISDEDIGLEFEKLNEPAPTKVVIIYVFLSYFDHRRGCHGRDCMVVGCSTTCAYTTLMPAMNYFLNKTLMVCDGTMVKIMVFNTTFNNMSWRSVL
jgi:hypothetical protein